MARFLQILEKAYITFLLIAICYFNVILMIQHSVLL